MMGSKACLYSSADFTMVSFHEVSYHSLCPLSGRPLCGTLSVNQANKTQMCQILSCVFTSSLPCPSTGLLVLPLLAATADFHNSKAQQKGSGEGMNHPHV